MQLGREANRLRLLVGAVEPLVGMHVAGKDSVNAILEQHLLHCLHHVIHLVLMRRVAVVPAQEKNNRSIRMSAMSWISFMTRHELARTVFAPSAYHARCSHASAGQSWHWGFQCIIQI